MHFVMYAFSNHVRVLHNVTPFVQLQQTAVLFDGVVVAVLHNVTPINLLVQSAALFCPKVESLHKPTRFAPSNHGYHK